MKTSRSTVLVLLGAFILQVMLAPHLAIFGIVPSFPLLVVITLAFFRGPTVGATAGFVSGMLLDLLGTGPVGAWALILTVGGYVAGLIQENVFAEGWLAPATITVVSALAADTSYLLILTILGVGPAFWESLLTVVMPRAVYNVVLLMLAYPWLARWLRSDRAMKSLGRLA